MKKLRLVGLLTLALLCVALSGFAKDQDGQGQDDNCGRHVKHVSAGGMSALGLLAASALCSGFYLVRRRVKSRK